MPPHPSWGYQFTWVLEVKSHPCARKATTLLIEPLSCLMNPTGHSEVLLGALPVLLGGGSTAVQVRWSQRTATGSLPPMLKTPESAWPPLLAIKMRPQSSKATPPPAASCGPKVAPASLGSTVIWGGHRLCSWTKTPSSSECG